MAGQPTAVPILLGLGLDEFSMVPAAIPQAKWIMARLDRAQAREIAEQALSLTSAVEVEELVRRSLPKLLD
jgi:phosphotransferase system enzyme I (PtsI)